MCYRYLFIICAVTSTFIANVTADVVWSGTQYQRTYHDIPAIDFNLDGTNDFTFSEVVGDSPIATYRDILIEPADGQIVVDKISDVLTGSGYPLTAGTVITANLNKPSLVWVGSETFLFSHGIIEGSQDYGGFFIDHEGYLGISFNTDGSTHYGWIKMSHDRNRPFPESHSLMIHGWAWETEADTPIIAGAIPEPSSGILTMVGSLALLQLARSRRRRRKQICKPGFGYHSQQEPKDPEKW